VPALSIREAIATTVGLYNVALLLTRNQTVHLLLGMEGVNAVILNRVWQQTRLRNPNTVVVHKFSPKSFGLIRKITGTTLVSSPSATKSCLAKRSQAASIFPGKRFD